MSAADIQAKAFTDNNVAREAIEALMWPNGPVCPHCGCMENWQGRRQVGSPWPLLLRRLQKAVHCHGRNHLRAFQGSAVKWWFAIHLLRQRRA